jgi:nucleotide-binding universal stress UspA family protein
MGFRDILVHADSTRAGRARTELAISLAQRFGARLIGLHVVPEPDVPPYYRPSAVEHISRIYAEAAREAGQKAEAQFREQLHHAGLNCHWHLVEGDVARQVAYHGQFADLVILGQWDREHPPGNSPFTLPEEVVVRCGRPILVVPETGDHQFIGRRILIAWDASREATRAVHDALPFLTAAEAVSLLSVNPRSNGRKPGGADPDQMVEHLKRHGIAAVGETLTGEESVSDLILSHAGGIGADLIPMGAYGHSRFRELVLGGTCREVLERMTVPVLISH